MLESYYLIKTYCLEYAYLMGRLSEIVCHDQRNMANKMLMKGYSEAFYTAPRLNKVQKM